MLPQPGPVTEGPLRSIVLILAATMLFSMSDAMAKYLGRTMPVIEIGWIRYATFVIVAAAIARQSGRIRLHVQSPTLQIIRGLSLLASGILFILALRFLPLAEAAAIGFVSPLFITLLSIPILGEIIGWRRWSAVVVGMIGVIVVIRPGDSAFQPASVYVIGSAASWALASVLTRRMAGVDSASTTLLWSAASGFVVLSLALPFFAAWPTTFDVALCVALGVVASTGQYLMVLAYRQAAASLLAPFSYIQLIWSTSLGYLVFAAVPDGWTLVGSAIIIGSGLYTVQRERVRKVPATLPPVAVRP